MCAQEVSPHGRNLLVQGLNSVGSQIRHLRLGITHLCLGIRQLSWEIRLLFSSGMVWYSRV